MHKSKFERFEELVQRVVEGSLGRLFGGQLDPVELSAELARAIDDNKRNGIAPNLFTIELHPTDRQHLEEAHPDVIVLLNRAIRSISHQWNLRLVGEPAVDFRTNRDVPRRYAQIQAAHSAARNGITHTMAAVPKYDPLEALEQLDAFLIVNSDVHIELNRPNMTLGRHSECDIRIIDKTVSRHHAQIRWRFGRFVLHDLGSQGGTYVNDQPVDEIVLRPGDVIRLSTIPIVYGEGLAKTRPRLPRISDDQTQPYTPLN